MCFKIDAALINYSKVFIGGSGGERISKVKVRRENSKSKDSRAGADFIVDKTVVESLV
jgi:hypothetical protein